MSGVKQSLYFTDDMLEEIAHEAKRQQRSMSWLVQQAWRIAHPRLKRTRAADDVVEAAVKARDPVE